MAVGQDEQCGPLLIGPGGERERGTPPKLSASQREAVRRAKKFAMEQGIKVELLKQTIVRQQQVHACFFLAFKVFASCSKQCQLSTF